MGNIRQERPNEGLILNVNKQKIWLPLNKNFGTHVEKYVVFKVFRNRRCIIPRIKVFSGVKNIILPKRSRSHNAKTGKHIHKIFGLWSETSMLINFRKVSSLSTEKWRSSWPEAGPE